MLRAPPSRSPDLDLDPTRLYLTPSLTKGGFTGRDGSYSMCTVFTSYKRVNVDSLENFASAGGSSA